jgi:AcrR family transcriptional regulator
MAGWNTEKLLAKALDEIAKDDNILFIEDVVAACGVGKTTFYRYIPKDSEEYRQVWSKIQENRVVVKKDIRMELRLSGKAAELLALYRMICTDEERRAINQQYYEMSGQMDNNVQIEFVGSGGKRKLAHSEDEVDVERRR